MCTLYVERKFKGMGHVTNIFWEAYYFQSVLYVHAQMVLNFFMLLCEGEIFLQSFCLPLRKHLEILKIILKAAS
jgi:hypothetical protein